MDKILFYINRCFDIIWLPFNKTNNYTDFIVISAISALIFLWIFKKTSDQEMIRKYKSMIFAHILMIRLYKDKPLLTLHSILNIIGYNFIYLRYTLFPLLIIFPLVLAISVQLNNRYGYLPLYKGDRFILRVDMDKTAVKDINESLNRIHCKTSNGIVLETPPLKIESEGSLFWRAKIIGSGEDKQEIKITMNNSKETIGRTIMTVMSKRRFSPVERKSTLSSFIFNNAEDGIPGSSPYKAITVEYRRATYPFIIWNTDPIVLYFILTLILGLVLKPFIKVDF